VRTFVNAQCTSTQHNNKEEKKKKNERKKKVYRESVPASAKG
jgi:hypothetical protein